MSDVKLSGMESSRLILPSSRLPFTCSLEDFPMPLLSSAAGGSDERGLDPLPGVIPYFWQLLGIKLINCI